MTVGFRHRPLDQSERYRNQFLLTGPVTDRKQSIVHSRARGSSHPPCPAPPVVSLITLSYLFAYSPWPWPIPCRLEVHHAIPPFPVVSLCFKLILLFFLHPSFLPPPTWQHPPTDPAVFMCRVKLSCSVPVLFLATRLISILRSVVVQNCVCCVKECMRRRVMKRYLLGVGEFLLSWPHKILRSQFSMLTCGSALVRHDVLTALRLTLTPQTKCAAKEQRRSDRRTTPLMFCVCNVNESGSHEGVNCSWKAGTCND